MVLISCFKMFSNKIRAPPEDADFLEKKAIDNCRDNVVISGRRAVEIPGTTVNSDKMH